MAKDGSGGTSDKDVQNANAEASAQERRAKAMSDTEKYQQSILKQAEKIKAANRDAEQAIKNRLKGLQDISAIEGTLQQKLDLRAQKVRDEIKLEEIRLANKQKELDILAETAGYTSELYSQANADLTNAQNKLKLLKDQQYSAEGMASAQEDIASAAFKFAGIHKDMNLTAKFAGFVGEAGSLRGAFENLAHSMGMAANKAMLVNSVSMKLSQGILAIGAMMIEQALALDTTESSLRQSMNVTREYASSVREVYHANKLNGITAEDAGAAFTSLHNTMSGFSQESKAMRESMTTTAAQLEYLGVSNSSFAEGMDMSTKAMRMTAEEARATQTDLARFAGELGMAPEAMAAGFANAGPSLAKFGEGATRAFKDVAKTAKETGIEINRILDYTNQFDTFEGAAERVGSLNAMLGGDFINAMDLMATEDPAERMAMITDAVHEAGKSFEEMGYYEKLALAEAAGFSDVEELGRAMAGNMDDNATSTEANAMSQEELAQINRQNLSLQQKMQATMAELAPSIMMVVDALNSMMLPIMNFVGKYGKVLLPMLLVLRGYMFLNQMAVNANAAAQARLNIQKAGGNALTAKGILISMKKTVIDQAETMYLYGLIAADKAKALQSQLGAGIETFRNSVRQKGLVTMGIERAVMLKNLIVEKSINAAKYAGAIASGVWSAAKGIYTAVTAGATIGTLAFGSSLIVATGGLILIIPLIIGIIAGLKAMWEKGGLAKKIVLGLGAAFIFMLGPIAWGIAAIVLMIKYWDKVKAAMAAVWEGIKSVGKFIFDALTWPFRMFWKYITSVWSFFMGKSPSPFAMTIVNGIKSVGKMLLNYLTWPYRMAWEIITGIFTKIKDLVIGVGTWIKDKIVAAWQAVKDFVIRNWETIKSISKKVLEIIGRTILFVMTGGWSEVVIFVIQHWDQIKAVAMSFFNWIGQKLQGLKKIGKVIADAIKWPFNAVIKMVNSMLAGLEKTFTLKIRVPKILPGPSKYQLGPPNLGRIPELARGTDDFQGGQALVGEEGPEMVNMPRGSAVAPASSTQGFAASLDKLTNMMPKMASAMSPVSGAKSIFGGLKKSLFGAGDKKESAKSVQINVTLELDKKVLARHTEEVMIDNLNPAKG